MNNIRFVDLLYSKVGYFALSTFLINTLLSGVAISTTSAGSSTWISFITYITYIMTKLYHVYSLIQSPNDIFYSAYLTQKVQFNDLDDKLKIHVINTDRV
jgi:hypothetical protein